MPVRRLLAVLAATLGAVGLGACSDGEPKPEVAMRMAEFELTLTPATADTGTIRIFIDNEGTMEHGLVFARATGRDELPLALDGSVDLSKVNVADRLEPIGPGRYRISPDLRPGPVVVFCNLVTTGLDGRPLSHFQAGMWDELNVTGDAVPGGAGG